LRPRPISTAVTDSTLPAPDAATAGWTTSSKLPKQASNPACAMKALARSSCRRRYAATHGSVAVPPRMASAPTQSNRGTQGSASSSRAGPRLGERGGSPRSSELRRWRPAPHEADEPSSDDVMAKPSIVLELGEGLLPPAGHLRPADRVDEEPDPEPEDGRAGPLAVIAASGRRLDLRDDSCCGPNSLVSTSAKASRGRTAVRSAPPRPSSRTARSQQVHGRGHVHCA
jgi:hypothetical protein